MGWNPERTVGAVVICTLGCAYRQWLIVSGPERGRMWADDRAGDRDLEPEQEPITFARWYRSWLDEATRSVRVNK